MEVRDGKVMVEAAWHLSEPIWFDKGCPLWWMLAVAQNEVMESE